MYFVILLSQYLLQLFELSRNIEIATIVNFQEESQTLLLIQHIIIEIF